MLQTPTLICLMLIVLVFYPMHLLIPRITTAILAALVFWYINFGMRM
jgi:hypothetical protein